MHSSYRKSLLRDLQPGSYCAQFKTYHDEMKENENEEPPVTEAELARVLELDAKATRGPWVAKGRYLGTPNHMSAVGELRDQNGNWSDTNYSCSNSELSAFYRTLTPRLARELAAARAAIKVAREKIRYARDKAWSYGDDKAAEYFEAALAQLNTHTHE